MNDKTLHLSAEDIAANHAARRAQNESDLRTKWDQDTATQWKNDKLEEHKELAAAFAGGVENPPTDPKFRNPVEGGSYYRDAATGELHPAQLDENGNAIAPHDLPNNGIPVDAATQATTSTRAVKNASAPGPGKAAPSQPSQPAAVSSGNQE